MGLIDSFKSFYRISAPAAKQVSPDKQQKLFRKFGFQSFLAGTIGYSLYYVCRTTLNVVKKPILDDGMLDATQLGLIGSTLLFAIMWGINGWSQSMGSPVAIFWIVASVVSFMLPVFNWKKSKK